MENKHIIIVEDDLAIQDVMRTILESRGFTITMYTSGEPLMNGDFEQPDLIILDKQLPRIDGLDVCRFLKSQEATKQIPVIILSASPQADVLAREALADDFLEEPFKMKVLREVVERLVR